MADRPRDLAERMARRRKPATGAGDKAGDGYLRESFTLPRAAARARAQAFFARYPKVELAGEPVYGSNMILRNIDHLPVRVSA